MDIVVPQLGESVIEARVARWLKREGEPVTTGEPLVELETDKIDLEVNADAAGVLSRIVHKDGDDVKVGEVLGVIDQAAGGAQAVTSAPPDVGRTLRSADTSAGPSTPPPPPPADVRATATARKVAAEHGVNLASVPGSGDGGRVTKEDVQKHVAGGQRQAASKSSAHRKCTLSSRPHLPHPPHPPHPSHPSHLSHPPHPRPKGV